MLEIKDSKQAKVRIGYDGRVTKEFRGPSAADRFENELRVLQYLEGKGCNFVPRVLDWNREALRLVTTHCGSVVNKISKERMGDLYAEVESFGVRHEDRFARNITYNADLGRFCVIDFEFATILETGEGLTLADVEAATASRKEEATEEKLAAAVKGAHSVAPMDLMGGPKTGTPEMALRWWARTDRGPFRRENEDAFFLASVDSEGVHLLGKEGTGNPACGPYVFAVSDGMGGANAGAFASRRAMDVLTDLLPKSIREQGGDYSRVPFERILQTCIQRIHESMVEMGEHYEECEGMGATFTLGLFCPADWILCHVGDSRAYFLPVSGGIEQFSEDHTHVGWLRRQGKLSEREARIHPERSHLQLSLGGRQRAVVPQIRRFAYGKGDRLVLCTDGLMEVLWERSLEGYLRKPPPRLAQFTPAERLIREALDGTPRDNMTVVVVEAGSE